VKSCWNGLVIFDAAPFYSGLEFRGIDDSLAQKHVEASECCLIHVDNSMSAEKGVWINPNVRVAYNEGADRAVNGEGGYPTPYGKVDGVWANRWHWTMGWYWRWREEWAVEGAVQEWEREEGRREEGTFCAVDSMQVLVDNGWVHI
jgi:Cryptococcal mannosyltransferase 1